MNKDIAKTDIFREPPIRYLGYANEVGEAFRGIIPNKVVAFSYGVAITYVLSHTVHRTVNIKKVEHKWEKAILTGFDTFLWQMLASVIIPGYTINRCCYGMSIIIKKTNINSKHSRIAVTGFGLILIPLIISPIDKSVDYMMDKVIRPSLHNFLKNKNNGD